jgi:hypothetical protein
VIFVRLWRLICRWFRRREMHAYQSDLDNLATQLSEWARKEAERDWFEWEPLAYPEPSIAQRRKVFEASRERAESVVGAARLEAITQAALPRLASNDVMHSMDPFGFVLRLKPGQWGRVNFRTVTRASKTR